MPGGDHRGIPDYVVLAPVVPAQIVVVPFLSLGIGIDDMFIFIYTMVRSRSESEAVREARRGT